MKNALFITALLIPCIARAGTYYIDYDNGDDANDGLTRTAAWKHCPGMGTAAGTSGSHTGKAGDTFVFKGGTVWQASAADTMFPLYVTYTSGWESGTRTNPISFTMDSTWYSGTEYSPPILDGGGLLGSVFELKYETHFIIDGFEIRHYGVEGYAVGAVILSLSHGTVVRNCYIHDWVTLAATDHKFGGIIVSGSDSVLIENCHIRGDSTAVSGIAVRTGGSAFEVRNCEIHMVPNAVLGGGKVHDCRIYDVLGSFDESMHENGIEMFSDCEVYDNVVHDVKAGVTVYLAASFNGTPGTGYFYNNLIYDCDPIPLRLDPDSSTYHVYNNTFIHSSSNVVVVNRPGYEPMKAVHVKNNIFITTESDYAASMGLDVHDILYYEVDYNCYITMGDVVWSHNDYGRMTLEQARSFGYDTNSVVADPELDSQYRPRNAGSPVVDAGTDLSAYFATDMDGNPRPAGGWDMGAFEYAGSGVSIPFAGSRTYEPASVWYDLRGNRIPAQPTRPGAYILSAGGRLVKRVTLPQ